MEKNKKIRPYTYILLIRKYGYIVLKSNTLKEKNIINEKYNRKIPVLFVIELL